MSEVVLDELQLKIKQQTEDSFKKYNKGVLNLATGTGKSYIAKAIIDDTLEEYPDSKVLWMAPKSAADNVASNEDLFNNSDYANTIIWAGFEYIRGRQDFVKENAEELENISLIVIDEAHKALAKYTYEGIKNILDKLFYKKKKSDRPNLLLMSASNVRSCDNVKTFETLAPELTAGRDYAEMGLDRALELGIIGEVKFLRCNLYESQKKIESIKKAIKEDKAGYINDTTEVENQLAFIKNYKENLVENLGSDINAHIQEYYDASKGDQWFVFVGTVEDASNNVQLVEDMFKVIYKHNENVKVNVYEYHSNNSEEENDLVLRKMTSKPQKDEVNVYITVRKGAESLHPEHIRGEIQLKRTFSLNFYEQLVGRVIKNKNYAEGPVFVVDAMDNADASKIGYSGANKIDTIREALVSKYGNLVSVGYVNDELYEIDEEYKTFINMEEIYKVFNEIKERLVKGKVYSDKEPKSIFKVFNKDELPLVVNLQKELYNGVFGRCHKGDFNTSPEYEYIIDQFGMGIFVDSEGVKYEKFDDIDGNVAYNKEDERITYKEIYEIYKGLVRNNWDYRKARRNTNFRNRLHKLRIEYLSHQLPLSMRALCYYLNIDMSGKDDDGINIINSVLKSLSIKPLTNEEMAAGKVDYYNKIQSLKKMCDKAENNETDDNTAKLKAIVNYIYFSNRYRNEKFKAVLVAFREEYSFLKEAATSIGYSTCEEFITAMIEVGRNKNSLLITKNDEIVIKMANKVYEKEPLTDLEKVALDKYKLSSSYNVKSANGLMEKTAIGKMCSIYDKYNEIDNPSDEESRRKAIIIEKLRNTSNYVMPRNWEVKIAKIISDNEKETIESQYTAETVLEECGDLLDKIGVIENTKIKTLINKINKLRKYGLTDEMMVAACFSKAVRHSILELKDEIFVPEMSEMATVIITEAKKMSGDCNEKLGVLISSNILSYDMDVIATTIIKMQ